MSESEMRCREASESSSTQGYIEMKRDGGSIQGKQCEQRAQAYCEEGGMEEPARVARNLEEKMRKAGEKGGRDDVHQALSLLRRGKAEGWGEGDGT